MKPLCDPSRRAGLLRNVARQLSSAVEMAKASAHYDLVVIGSGPAAQKCAIESAKSGKSVAVVDKNSMLGGVCVHTGTIPSKTFREAVLHVTGWGHQGFYGKSIQRARASVSIPDLLMRVKKVESRETEVIRDKLQREGVELISGTARFLEGVPGEPHRVLVLRSDTQSEVESKTSIYRHIEATLPTVTLSADRFLVACGTRPVRRPGLPFDGERVFDSDQLLWGGVKKIPRDLIVVGAGVIGMEYASMINIIQGTTVSVIDPRDEVLGFADREVVQALCHSMRKNGARFLLGEKLKSVSVTDEGQVVAYLLSGKRVVGDALLYCMGRFGNTDSLNIEAIGVKADDRGLLKVNDSYQTEEPDVYACGDVIGYPALASTSMEQGLRAAHHMWSEREMLGVDHGMEALEGEDEEGQSPPSGETEREEEGEGKGAGDGEGGEEEKDKDQGEAGKSPGEKPQVMHTSMAVGGTDTGTGVGTVANADGVEEGGGNRAWKAAVRAWKAKAITKAALSGEGENNPAPFLMNPPPTRSQLQGKNQSFPFVDLMSLKKALAEGRRSSENLFPYGIYTIPEISMVGKTEQDLTLEGVTYEVGVAQYRELAKGQMLGGVDGFLKLVFDTDTLKLLGVHAFGEGATEIIHIGQVVMSQGGTIKYFQTAVFNYPTLAEAYNVAARDGLRRVGMV